NPHSASWSQNTFTCAATIEVGLPSVHSAAIVSALVLPSSRSTMKRSRSPHVAACRLRSSVARTDGNAAATIRSTSARLSGASGRGPARQKRDLARLAQRQLPLLNVSIEQVIWPLVGDHRGDLQRPHELAVRGIAEPDRQRLPPLLQGVELLELPLPAFHRFVQLYQIHTIR